MVFSSMTGRDARDKRRKFFVFSGACAIFGIYLLFQYASTHKIVLMDVDVQSLDMKGTGKEYYLRQKSVFEASAKNFLLHPYWVGTEKYVDQKWWSLSKAIPWSVGNNVFSSMMHARAQNMNELFETLGLDGYKIEKDKCIMSQWLKDAEIPQQPILGPWRNLSSAVAALHAIKDGTESGIQFPLLLKACHITQGGQHGVNFIDSKEAFAERFDEYLTWVENFFVLKAVDTGRKWETTVRNMLSSLSPGIMAVEAFPIVVGERAPFEIKVEVVWGRAYMGFWAYPMGPTVDRQCNLEHEFQYGALHPNSTLQPDELRWFCDNGHLQPVFALAERTARAAGVDQMRVDIFVNPADPEHPVVNENSLFSMQGHHQHTVYIGRVWLDGYLKREYHVPDMNPNAPPYRIEEPFLSFSKNTV
eukprot:m.19168 g.19168  ORF g.19168 m.19168 type:complete len:417 (+) comp11725_c0_seq1:117-1367(+)